MFLLFEGKQDSFVFVGCVCIGGHDEGGSTMERYALVIQLFGTSEEFATRDRVVVYMTTGATTSIEWISQSVGTSTGRQLQGQLGGSIDGGHVGTPGFHPHT